MHITSLIGGRTFLRSGRFDPPHVPGDGHLPCVPLRSALISAAAVERQVAPLRVQPGAAAHSRHRRRPPLQQEVQQVCARRVQVCARARVHVCGRARALPWLHHEPLGGCCPLQVLTRSFKYQSVDHDCVVQISSEWNNRAYDLPY